MASASERSTSSGVNQASPPLESTESPESSTPVRGFHSEVESSVCPGVCSTCHSDAPASGSPSVSQCAGRTGKRAPLLS